MIEKCYTLEKHDCSSEQTPEKVKIQEYFKSKFLIQSLHRFNLDTMRTLRISTIVFQHPIV